MQRKTVAILAALGGAILWGGTLATRTNDIEQDLGAKSQAALTRLGLTNLDVEFAGRDAKLTGKSPGKTLELAALNAVKKVWGVRVVDAEFTPLTSEEIAAKLRQESLKALKQHGFGKLDVQFTGTDGVITGISPGTDKEIEALGIVQKVDGVSSIQGSFTPPPPSAKQIAAKLRLQTLAALKKAGYDNLTVTFKGSEGHISGVLKDSSQEPNILNIAKKIPGVSQINGAFRIPQPTAAQIASKLTGQAGQALKAAHFDKLAVKFTHRNGLITGPSPGVLEEDQAIAVVSAIDGVELVTGEFTSASGKIITPEQREVARTCAKKINSTLAIGTIEFTTGSAAIKASSHRLLDNLATATLACTDAIIHIYGHTDSVGSASNNQKLSAARAQSVATYLNTKGLLPARVRTTGFGATRPIADNNTDEGRARNRRIEFRVVL